MPRTVRVPVGIDPGFAYAPGRVSQLGEAVRQRLLASATRQPHIAALGISNMLERGTVSAALGEHGVTGSRREKPAISFMQAS